MPRVAVSSNERAYIKERIDRFADEAPEDLQWQLVHVRAHGALPLHIGWTETVGICPDGTLVRWSTEGDWAGARELEDAPWVTIALVEGAARYPLLRRLVPQRPDDARTCEACGGAGRLALHPTVICECGGVGWIATAG